MPTEPEQMRSPAVPIVTGMPELRPPSTSVHQSFLAAMAEFANEGRTGDNTNIGEDLARLGDSWHDPAVFARYCAALREDARPETARPEGRVACTTLWLVDDDGIDDRPVEGGPVDDDLVDGGLHGGGKYLGRLAVRHRLTDWLFEYGGHIGYDVRASARGRGHATAMLGAGLGCAAELGIEDALVTCNHDNVASRRVIEKCGGRFEDRRGTKLRYWVRTHH